MTGVQTCALPICAIEICAIDMMKICQEYGCGYINSATEIWDYKNVYDPLSYTLYPIIKDVRNFSDELKKSGKINFNAVIDMGCNPGNVSLWAKVGLDMINKHYKTKKTAEELDIRTIHISEYDTQRSSIPKRINEYCNTWSSDGESYFDEALSPVELSYGTHEKNYLNKDEVIDRKSTRLNSSHIPLSRMPSSA